MLNQGVQARPSSEQSDVENHLETEITSDSNIIPYSQYVHETQQAAVQNSISSAQQDTLILSMIEQLKTQVINCTKINLDNKSVNDTLTVELERYKEQVKVLKEGQNVDLKSQDNVSDSCEQSVEIDRLKQTLSEQLKEKESLMQTVTLLKNDFKKEESRNIDREIALEKKIKQLDNIVYKRDQSAQTKAQQLEPKLYDGNVIKSTSAIVIPDSEETLMLAEESRSKMLLKQQDPMVLEKKVNTTPVDYDNSMNSLDSSPSYRPTKVEVPKELPKVSMCLKLETELLNKKDFIEKETYDKLFRSYTTLEKHCISLEVDTQLNQEIFQRDNSVSDQSAPNFDQYFELNELKAQSQEKDTIIRKFKERIKSLSGNMNKDKVKKDIEEIETINIELDHRVSKLIAENEHLKQTYKQLYESIKPTHIRSKEQSLKDELRKLKGKYLADNIVTKHIIAPEMLKFDVEPIAPKLLNNRTAHSDYLRHTQEQAVILREVVEQGKSQNPLYNSLDSACKYTKRIQELLIIIRQTCPSINNSSDKLVVVTPQNKDKRVRFTEPVTSSGNTNIKTASSLNLVSNKPMLPSTGVKPSTSASGSHPSSNTKKDKIQRTPRTANVQNSKLNANSKLLCVKCKVFTKIGYAWRPTGRTFTIVGNVCPLTMITTTAEVPLMKPTDLETDTPKPVVILVYSRKPRKSKTNVPVNKPKIIKSISANKEPSKSWGSIVFDVPSSSLDECRSSKLFSGIWTPAAPSI
ncbi:hypothetical protein Tco_1377508 [Tanacetum coccineum]